MIERPSHGMVDVGSSILITGGYGGIGRHAAQAIHDTWPDSLVIVAGRDEAAARDACAAIGPRARPLVVDLASLPDVDRLATTMAAQIARCEIPPLRAIVCNAGTQSPFGRIDRSADGLELSFAVNHLAHFHLVTRLLPAMRGPRARVVVVSSGTHDPATIEGRFNAPRYERAILLARPELDPRRPLSSIRRYASSKLCNLLFAYELARRQESMAPGLGLDVLAFDPGAVPATGLLRHLPAAAKAVIAWPPLLRLAGVRVTTPQLAGHHLARLVTNPALDGIGSAYFGGDRLMRSSLDSYDQHRATDLWTTSEQLVAETLAP